MQLEAPLNQTAYVLRWLIGLDKVTKEDFHDVKNLPARISDLRLIHNLEIETIKIRHVNKFGNSCVYGEWKLLDKEKAKEVYLKINKK